MSRMSNPDKDAAKKNQDADPGRKPEEQLPAETQHALEERITRLEKRLDEGLDDYPHAVRNDHGPSRDETRNDLHKAVDRVNSRRSAKKS
jgi:hypothetical protein